MNVQILFLTEYYSYQLLEPLSLLLVADSNCEKQINPTFFCVPFSAPLLCIYDDFQEFYSQVI